MHAYMHYITTMFYFGKGYCEKATSGLSLTLSGLGTQQYIWLDARNDGDAM